MSQVHGVLKALNELFIKDEILTLDDSFFNIEPMISFLALSVCSFSIDISLLFIPIEIADEKIVIDFYEY